MNFTQFVLIHRVKGFSRVKEAGVDVFLEFPSISQEERSCRNKFFKCHRAVSPQGEILPLTSAYEKSFNVLMGLHRDWCILRESSLLLGARLIR